LNNLFELLLAQVRADRKKAVVLALLTVIMVGVYARLALRGGAADAAADAGASAASGAAAASPGALPSAAGAYAPGATTGAAGMIDAVATTGFARHLSRDLFETDWEAFRPTPELAEELTRRHRPRAEPTGGIRTFWRQILLRAAEQRREEELRRREVEKQSAALKLQGIVTGDHPKAYVDGRWVTVDEFIGGFRVVRISAQEVELLKSGVHVRLTMP
jgi:hypothetical protein